MSDRVSASIKIGGSLTSAQAESLADLLLAEDLATDWDGKRFEPADLCTGNRLELFAHEVPWGIFRDLEAYLIANRLPFVRQSGSYSGSFGGERVIYRGGSAETAKSYGIDESDCVVIDHRTVVMLGTIDAILDHFAEANFDTGPITIAEARDA
jgi:hypothetical protein